MLRLLGLMLAGLLLCGCSGDSPPAVDEGAGEAQSEAMAPGAISSDNLGGRVFEQRRAQQIGDTEGLDAPSGNVGRGRSVGYRALAVAPPSFLAPMIAGPTNSTSMAKAAASHVSGARMRSIRASTTRATGARCSR